MGSKNVSAAAAEPAAVLLDQIYQLYAAEGHGEPCIRCTFLIGGIIVCHTIKSCAPALQSRPLRPWPQRRHCAFDLERSWVRAGVRALSSCTVQTSAHGCQGLKITLCFLEGFCVIDSARLCVCAT